MNKIKRHKWWKYSIVSLITVLLFGIFVPSCTYLSSTRFNISVWDKQQKAIANETKSLAQIVAHLPTAEQIKTMPLAPHPRLLASEARFAEIRKQIKSDRTTREWYEKLHQQGDNFLQEELPAYRLLDGKRLFRHNKALLRRITTFALLYKLKNEPVYLDRVWQELKVINKFDDWNPSNFLDTARITYIFALSYDWLYADWNREQRETIRLAILNKGLKPAFAAYQEDKWWIDAKQNWNQVCNGGVGVGALAIVDEYPEISSKILNSALKGISSAMENYAPDGAWNEGTHYWNFGSRFNVLFLAALNTALNTDFNLSDAPGFSETGLFPIYMNSSSRLTFNFSDGKEGVIKAPQLLWLSNRFEKKAYADYQRKMASPEPLDIIWYQPDQKGIDLQKLPLDKYFRGAEVVSMRSEWGNPEGIFVGFKAGDNNSSHSNLDLGTFVIDALGVRWAEELGYDDYNLPGYFDKKEQRWTYYRMRAEGQNTLIVNPSEAPDQNPLAKAKIIKFDSKPMNSYAVADLTSAYYPQVKHLERSISLDRQAKQVIIKDEIEAKTPVDVWWFMHTKAQIKIDKDGYSAVLQRDNARLQVRLLNSRSSYKFVMMNAEPLASSPDPEAQDRNEGISKLAIHVTKAKKETIELLFTLLK